MRSADSLLYLIVTFVPCGSNDRRGNLRSPWTTTCFDTEGLVTDCTFVDSSRMFDDGGGGLFVRGQWSLETGHFHTEINVALIISPQFLEATVNTEGNICIAITVIREIRKPDSADLNKVTDFPSKLGLKK